MSNMRSMRACMVCSLVQSQSQFVKLGCPNCDSILQLAGNPDMVQDCTSQVFEGLIAMGNPNASWVAKWQRISDYIPGVYAVKVVGTLPDEVVGALEDAGVGYVRRDGGAEEDEGRGEE